MLRIALPNKGRLADKTLALLEKTGLRAEFTSSRALMATLGSDFQAIFVRADDIPEFVADGAADIGVTGADLIAESGRDLVELMDLGFGRCHLAVAVQESSPINAVSDIKPGMRVATSFPRLTKDYFDRQGIAVEIARVSGAAEIAPHLGVAELIVDLVSTGSTLRVNKLREVATVLESSARIVVRESADGPPPKAILDLVTAIESVLRAETKRYLMTNIRRDAIEEAKKILPGINGPTIVEVADGDGWVAAHAVVDADRVYQTIAQLKDIGAEGILVTRIERLTP